MNRKTRSRRKSLVVIALALVLVPTLLFMLSEGGMMLMSAVSEQRMFKKGVCGSNRQRLAEIDEREESGLWIFRYPIKGRPSNRRVELGLSDEYLNAILESEYDETALSGLNTLYGYEYCRGNNPLIDIYDRDFDGIAAVFRASPSKTASGFDWHSSVYDCRLLERSKAIVKQMVEAGYWEKVDSIDEDWRGNPILKVYSTPKFHPQMLAETPPEKRWEYFRVRNKYYSAAAMYGICTGHHYLLQHDDPAIDSDILMQIGPKSLKEDIEQIQGLPKWKTVKPKSASQVD